MYELCVGLKAYISLYCITGKSDHFKSLHAILLQTLYGPLKVDAETFVCAWVYRQSR